MKKLCLLCSLVLFIFACSSDNGGTPTTDDDGIGGTDDSPPVGGDEVGLTFTPCENGFAEDFPCDGYDLLRTIPLSVMEADRANDVWGWTDTANNREYAIIGLDNGTGFVDITDDDNIVYLGKLPSATLTSIWRDIKIYQDHAFIVSEADNHGMQVFDLTRLRGVSANNPETFDADARYTGFGNAHNIVINEATGFAYPVGTDRNDEFRGGAHFVDIRDPINPIGVGGYADNGYTHDAQVITYTGMDADYQGSEIFIGANENELIVADITNKDNPIAISTMVYDNIGYTHQGWFTEDQRFFILGDELDEINFGFDSRTVIFDMADLDNPVIHMNYTGTTEAIDHNGYVLGNEFYLANYNAGMRVLDISDIENRIITESGFFDTVPGTNGASFDGVWSVFPYFESGKIVISDIDSGLFVVRKTP